MSGNPPDLRQFARQVTVSVLMLASSAAPAADRTAGRLYFAANCAACHSTSRGAHSIGPSLAGIIGRKSGSAPGYKYSTGLKAANITWTSATLDHWLQSPSNAVHTTRMTITVPRAEDRQNLIAYLWSL